MTTLLRLVATALQAVNLFPKLCMYEVKHISIACHPQCDDTTLAGLCVTRQQCC